jgi:hypothetical protein
MSNIEITKVPLRKVTQEPYAHGKGAEIKKVPMLYGEVTDKVELNWSDRLNIKLKVIGAVTRMVPHFITFITGYFMKDWKTTMGAIVAAAGILLEAFGAPIPKEALDAVTVIGVVIIGFFSKDKETVPEKE